MKNENHERLIRAYREATGHMSFAHMARRTEEYKALVAAGPAIVPAIIERFRAGKYSALLFPVLTEITGANPVVSEVIPGAGGEPSGFIGIKVADSAAAWVAWFDANQKQDGTAA